MIKIHPGLFVWVAAGALLRPYFFMNPQAEQSARRDIAIMGCHETNGKNCDQAPD
jgi:hypothetical protein